MFAGAGCRPRSQPQQQQPQGGGIIAGETLREHTAAQPSVRTLNPKPYKLSSKKTVFRRLITRLRGGLTKPERTAVVRLRKNVF